MLLQKAPELQDRRFVRHRFVEQVQAGEAAHARHVVQGVFHTRVGQVEPLLHEVEAQHRFQRPRTPPLAGLRVVRIDQLHQRRPGHHEFHFRQELLPPGLPLLPLFRQGREGYLLHPLPVVVTNFSFNAHPDRPLTCIRLNAAVSRRRDCNGEGHCPSAPLVPYVAKTFAELFHGQPMAWAGDSRTLMEGWYVDTNLNPRTDRKVLPAAVRAARLKWEDIEDLQRATKVAG